jgi:PIN domain nuclease of toxin-antitoxin system
LVPGSNKPRLLLDTHALLWWLDGDPKLSPAAQKAIGDETTEVLVSAASAWEIATKVRIGKLPGAVDVAKDFLPIIESQRFTPASISVEHAILAGSMRDAHRDPFDRMLIAQARCDGLTLVSNEALFDRFGVRRLW